jgi:hypothetical protein
VLSFFALAFLTKLAQSAYIGATGFKLLGRRFHFGALIEHSEDWNEFRWNDGR